MILGIHCSVRNGYLAAVQEARRLGLKAFQMLPYRRHHEPAEADFAAFRQSRAAAGIERLLVHSRFLPALAASDPQRRRHTVAHLLRELRIARALGAQAYVLHVGAFSPGAAFDDGARAFRRSLEEARGETAALPLLIENVPGGGRRMGGSLEELARLLEAARAVWPEAAVCLDTAHAWAAGADLSPAGLPGFLAEVRTRLGDAVAAWHLNDSAAERGSRLESHWHLGQGRIGAAALRALLRGVAATDATVILETPQGEVEDRSNVEWVRGVLGSGGLGVPTDPKTPRPLDP